MAVTKIVSPEASVPKLIMGHLVTSRPIVDEPILKMLGSKLVMVRHPILIGQLVVVGRLTMVRDMREVLTAICNLVANVARVGVERMAAVSSRCMVSEPMATTVAPAMTTTVTASVPASVPSATRYCQGDHCQTEKDSATNGEKMFRLIHDCLPRAAAAPHYWSGNVRSFVGPGRAPRL
jgi:hypothetical protein